MVYPLIDDDELEAQDASRETLGPAAIMASTVYGHRNSGGYGLFPYVHSPVGSDVGFQHRICARSAKGQEVANEGYAITATDIQTITCTLYQDSDGEWVEADDQPTISSSVISGSLHTDGLWVEYGRPKDSIGRNMLHVIKGEFVTEAVVYRVEYTVTLTDGSVLVWNNAIDAR